MARVQAAGCAARSAVSQSSWREPSTQPPTAEQFEFRTMTCQVPASYEYQPSWAGPPAAPK